MRADAAAKRREGIALLAAAVLLLLPGLGGIDLWAPDEPRYAQVAEEMRSFRHGFEGLVLLRLNGEIYTQKPPLYYWLAALLGSVSGQVGEVAARLPSAAAGIACVLLAWALGRRLFPRSGAGAWGAILLLTVFRFAHQARRAQLDVLLTLFELLALSAYWRLAGEKPGQPRSRGALALLHGATGLALLTKGPVGLLPFLVIAVHLGWERRLRDLRGLFPLWGSCLSLGPLLLWLGGAAGLAPDGFFADAVLDNVLARFLSGTAHVRPFYYFAYQFPLDFLPWTFLWPLAAVVAGRQLRTQSLETAAERRAWRFLLAWLGTMLAFFSLSAGKRGLYLLPAFPAAALACGAALAAALDGRSPPRWLEPSGIALLGGLGVAGLALALTPGLEVPGAPGFALPARFGLVLTGIAIASSTACVGAIRLGLPQKTRLAVLVTGILAVELAAFTLLYPAFDSEKSPRPIAEAAARITGTQDRVGVYRHRALTGGVAYYSGRPTVALETPEEVERFATGGGRAIILKPRHRPALSSVTPLVIRAEARHGRRKILLAELTTPHLDVR